MNPLIQVVVRRCPPITCFNLGDLLHTRRRKLVVHGAYVPPLFPFIAPTGREHVPYIVRQPPGVRWAGWPVAGHNVEDDDTVPSIPEWYDLREDLVAKLPHQR